MRVGIYVGSFNPVHKGHKYIIDYLLDNNYVDKIEVISTGNYWDKNNLIDINDRIEMLKFYESKRIIINDNLNNLEYTYQILRKLKNDNDELYLIIGIDNLPKFHLWKNIEEIMTYRIIVIPRSGLNTKECIKQYINRDNFIFLDNFKPINISSTNIRSLIKKNKISELSNFIDKKVLDYIVEKKLYGGIK